MMVITPDLLLPPSKEPDALTDTVMMLPPPVSVPDEGERVSQLLLFESTDACQLTDLAQAPENFNVMLCPGGLDCSSEVVKDNLEGATCNEHDGRTLSITEIVSELP